MSYKGKKQIKAGNVYDSSEGYDLYAEVYDEDLDYLNTFEQGTFLKLLGNDLSGKRVLDLGCGTGRIVPSLKARGAEVVGCDISEKMVARVKEKFGIEAVVCDAEEMPFKNEEFDIVCGLFLIVHLRDLQLAFDEIYRVLKSEGVFILSNINQRKAPKLKLKSGEEIVIKSHYHMPHKVLEALEDSFFEIEEEEFVMDGHKLKNKVSYEESNVWVNQLIKARK